MRMMMSNPVRLVGDAEEASIDRKPGRPDARAQGLA
jgi:hypothetical protein